MLRKATLNSEFLRVKTDAVIRQIFNHKQLQIDALNGRDFHTLN
nr:MAG TPA_asm: hypothetical protein [Caudoviricetes sp.]